MQAADTPKLLRYLALRRFGRAFDDAGSWPRAAAHIIPLHRGLGLILVNNRETIQRGLRALLLPLRVNSVGGSSGFSPGSNWMALTPPGRMGTRMPRPSPTGGAMVRSFPSPAALFFQYATTSASSRSAPSGSRSASDPCVT